MISFSWRTGALSIELYVKQRKEEKREEDTKQKKTHASRQGEVLSPRNITAAAGERRSLSSSFSLGPLHSWSYADIFSSRLLGVGEKEKMQNHRQDCKPSW